ncbi:hypothetical protein GCM10007301_38100 [Azorhizobium oxalatiphilum]|uniref:Uncharacterized protein n=1 Tax=Azorhizobium oxalatiphilum TaxID=980631 RepID=A0A917C7R6_9HYPH|nr:hypothetical protein [Azorhizobium oxalatiphilum]GGF74621.1 hypothetical protein GCM10007301_38100 [Azorhizobium oxalatiphilum]
MSSFKRGIRKLGMMDALGELAKQEGWWRDVLLDTSLIIGVRDDYLNVYWRGQSLFKVEMKRGQIVASTHPKYLLDPDLSGQVSLDPETGTFGLSAQNALIQTYQPGETLGKLKRAANLFASEEKRGVQAIATSNANVVDVEIAFPAGTSGQSVPRIDIASFDEVGNDVKLVFWEAKVLGNPELRVKGEKNVVKQIGAYVGLLSEHAADIVSSYTMIAGNLTAFCEMSGGVRRVASSIEKVAKGTELTLAEPADVKLLVFGFNADQRDGLWRRLLEELEGELPAGSIIARGDAAGIKL